MNFLSTGNDWTEINLNSNNSTLIIGENGAGKSTLLDAITYSLYNKPFRKINKPQLINSINNKKSLVEIFFSVNEDTFMVRRGMKPNIFEVYQNDKLLNQEAASQDYQEVLEKHILKLNYKSFCQVVILGSASFVPFMQLSALNRREIIEDLLDLQIFTTMNTLLKEKASLNSKNIIDNDYNLDLSKEKLKLQDKHLEKMSMNHRDIIENYEKKIEANRESIQSNEKIIDEINTHIESLKESNKDNEDVKRKISKLIDFESQLNMKIEHLQKEKSFFHDNESCPTCNQNIDEDFKKETITKKETTIDMTKDGLIKLKEELDKYMKRQKEISDTESKISEMNTDVFVRNKSVRHLIDMNKELEQEIAELQEKHESYTKEDDNISILENEIERLGIERKELYEQRDIYQFSSVLLKDSGIKSRIIKQYIPVINKLINKYLAEMEFVVHFELDESFNETIKSRFRDVFSYSSFSEGEKMRINLAILFTWRAIAKIRNSASTSLLILDEIFDGSLDAAGTEEFMKILNSLIENSNTFIISHKTEQLQDKFENVIKFEKYKNFSRIAA